jgi:hypothetical protein
MDVRISKENTEKVIAYLASDSPKVIVDRSAFDSMLKDLDRHKESAGYLLGSYENGEVTMEKYVPAKGIKRFTYMVVYDAKEEAKQFEAFRKEGCAAIASMHTHPYQAGRYDINTILSKPSILEGFGNLSEPDKGHYEYDRILGRRTGFSVVLCGEVNLYGMIGKGKKEELVVVNIFDSKAERMPIAVVD